MSAKYIREVTPVEAITPKNCVACSGSGRYDTTGSPVCEACNGTGLEPFVCWDCAARTFSSSVTYAEHRARLH